MQVNDATPVNGGTIKGVRATGLIVIDQSRVVLPNLLIRLFNTYLGKFVEDAVLDPFALTSPSSFEELLPKTLILKNNVLARMGRKTNDPRRAAAWGHWSS